MAREINAVIGKICRKDVRRPCEDKFSNAVNGITGFFSGLWDDISEGAKGGINGIIDKLNDMIDSVENMINNLIDGLNTAANLGSGALAKKLGFGEGEILSHIMIPYIPHLAKGGIASAPTLAMIGDNPNARNDPEVVAPLSKLKGMMTGSELSEIVELLRLIVELLKSGMNIEVINYMFRNSAEFSREVLKVVRDNRIRGGT